jgi:hypothetical protein
MNEIIDSENEELIRAHIDFYSEWGTSNCFRQILIFNNRVLKEE